MFVDMQEFSFFIQGKFLVKDFYYIIFSRDFKLEQKKRENSGEEMNFIVYLIKFKWLMIE